MRALLNRQEVIEGSLRCAERENNEYCNQIRQLSNDLRIVRQERDEYQRCYNAHDELLNQKEDKLEGLLEKNRQLEDYNQMMAESMVLKEEKISDLKQGLEVEVRMRQEAEREVMVMMGDRKKLNEVQAELGKWRVAVAHERAWNGGNLRGKGAAAEYERLNEQTNYSMDFWLGL